MPVNSPVILLRKAMEANKDDIEVFLEENFSVVCINKTKKNKKSIAFSVLYNNNQNFWMQNEAWEYFISKDDYHRIIDKISKTKTGWVPQNIEEDQEEEEHEELEALDEVEDGYGREYEDIVTMSEPERVRQITEDKNRLENLIAQKPRQEHLVTEALVETARDALLHNHAAIMDAMNLSDDEARKNTQALVDSTFDLVKTSAQLISSNIFNDELMNTLVAKSNGTIIQHMTRVHLNGLAFLTYYNNLVSSSSAIIKLRINFEKQYRPFYKILLPDVDPEKITLEKVFLGGMRAVSESDFYNWAVGFLIHDIGKAAAVEYHEGESAYNRDIVIEHVKVGYTSVMHKTNYPRDAGLITGYHHEYYGDQGGYGYFRSYLDQYTKSNPKTKPDSCIAFEIEPMIDCKALSFFPAKVLEIVDVFDSVTDPNRKYRKAMTTEEALTMMHEEFIVKHPKLDLVLFDIFSKFVREKEAG